MLNPRDFERIKQELFDYVLVARGDLDAEYKRLIDATKEWDKRSNLPQQQAILDQRGKDLAKAKSDFEAYQQKVQATLDGWEAKLAAKEKALLASIGAHKQNEAALASDQAAHAANVEASAQANAKTQAELEQQRAELANLQNGLHQREVAVAAREAKVSAALDKLKLDWAA
jgi:chromosome segregation ATPase